MLQSPQPMPIKTVLTPLINEIATFPDRIILILDDYHVLEASQVDDILAFLLENLPPHFHLVFATREDPHLPLARLRASNQLSELRVTNLRFFYSEAAEFLNQTMGLNLSVEDITLLETRTEGWIVGLQLAAISLQGQESVTNIIKSFSGSHRLVLDYLIEEVLSQQSENIQTFLLQTAILDRFNDSLCDALTGQDNGRENLELLEHANLFIIPLDEERSWYRYHHLFADLLRQRLRQIHVEQVPFLHIRASEWFEENKFSDEAIEHALRANGFERAAHLIEKQADTVWQSGEHGKIRSWLDKLPIELVFSKPHLSIINAWNLYFIGQMEEVEQSLHAVDKVFDSTIDKSEETTVLELDYLHDIDKKKILGRAAAMRALLSFFHYDIPGAKKFVHQALEYLPEQDFHWRCMALVALGDALGSSGDIPSANQTRLKALELSKAAGNAYLVLGVSIKLAMGLKMQGQLKQALEICQHHFQLAKS